MNILNTIRGENKMTRKHYIKIADCILEIVDWIKGKWVIKSDEFVEDLCRMFKEDDSRFDINRFKDYLDGYQYTPEYCLPSLKKEK